MPGKTKIRATAQGDMADIKVLIIHPMETGQRKDTKTGQLIPAHFITNVTATVNGKTVVEAQWSQAVSTNPYFGFRVKGAKAGDMVKIAWVDNKGESDNAEATVG